MSIENFHAPENAGVLFWFEKISQIPRPSYGEKRISDYLAAFAKDHQLTCIQDELYNIIMIREASKGREADPPLILQAHMDMVCEKENGLDFDFNRDPLRLKRDGDYLFAEGTTLGGDDGIGVAMILALLADEDLCCPRLEAVITICEETGMEGAFGLDVSPLKGKRLLNLDSEDEGVLLCSCAGGSTGNLVLPVERESASGLPVTLSLCGLLGGHSGNEIHRERGNACILLGRLLYMLHKDCDFSLTGISGGSKQNAIPREATAALLLSPDSRDAFAAKVRALEEVLKNEYLSSDPGLSVSCEISESPEEALGLTKDSLDHMLSLLLLLPNGVQAMNTEIDGLVKTSLNLGILTLEEKELRLTSLLRSSVDSEKRNLEEKVGELLRLLGGSAEFSSSYPAWEWKKDSDMRTSLAALYKEMYGKEARLDAIHAGVECGIFCGKIKDLDAVSIGPDMSGIHTTEERLSISSSERVFAYVKKFVES